MDFILNLRGRNHEDNKKNFTKLDGQNHRDSDSPWHDLHRIRSDLLEIVVFLDKFLNNCFIQPDGEHV
jgi:hypothetical protein